MGALNIRDIGDDRKAALEAEAKGRGVSVAALVRRFLDDGLKAAQASRSRREWLAEARAGLAYEVEDLTRNGPSLARHRKVPGPAQGVEQGTAGDAAGDPGRGA